MSKRIELVINYSWLGMFSPNLIAAAFTIYGLINSAMTDNSLAVAGFLVASVVQQQLFYSMWKFDRLTKLSQEILDHNGELIESNNKLLDLSNECRRFSFTMASKVNAN